MPGVEDVRNQKMSAYGVVGEHGQPVEASTDVRFATPGTYVLRAVADDTVFLTPVDVTVTVNPPPAGP